jgi:hypothetical protein
VTSWLRRGRPERVRIADESPALDPPEDKTPGRWAARVLSRIAVRSGENPHPCKNTDAWGTHHPGRSPLLLPGYPFRHVARVQRERFFAARRRGLAYRESSTKPTAAPLAGACMAGDFRSETERDEKTLAATPTQNDDVRTSVCWWLPIRGRSVDGPRFQNTETWGTQRSAKVSARPERRRTGGAIPP